MSRQGAAPRTRDDGGAPGARQREDAPTTARERGTDPRGRRCAVGVGR